VSSPGQPTSGRASGATGKPFVSYATVDRPFVLQVAADLRQVGIDVWVDYRDIPKGVRWDDEIEAAVHACSAFVLFLSPASVASQNVKDEIGVALRRGIPIVPVLYKPCTVPLRVDRFQRVDLSWDYVGGMRELIGALSKVVAQRTSPPTARSTKFSTVKDRRPQTTWVEEPRLRPSGRRLLVQNLFITLSMIVIGGYALYVVIGPKLLGLAQGWARPTAVAPPPQQGSASAPTVLIHQPVVASTVTPGGRTNAGAVSAATSSASAAPIASAKPSGTTEPASGATEPPASSRSFGYFILVDEYSDELAASRARSVFRSKLGLSTSWYLVRNGVSTLGAVHLMTGPYATMGAAEPDLQILQGARLNRARIVGEPTLYGAPARVYENVK
jgi:hypothetical protein